MALVVCETVAAIVRHLRELGDEAPNYSGTTSEKKTLCGVVVGWDTKDAVSDANCRECLIAFAGGAKV